MPDFIPRRDAEAVMWSGTFAQWVVSDYQTFGFSQQDAEQLAALQAQFADAVQLAGAPSTRTTAVVIERKTARKAFEQQARWMAGCIRVNPEISLTTKINLGLIIGPGRDAPRRRIGRPNSAPLVSIVRVTGSRVRIKLKNAEYPSLAGMAPDIKYASVYSCVADTPPTRIGEWVLMRATSRTRLTLEFDATYASGAKVWLAAVWANARGQTGPVSTPVFTYLGYVSVAPGGIVA